MDHPEGTGLQRADRVDFDGQVGDLLLKFQERGTLSADLDATAFGRILFNNLNHLFIAFVTHDTMTLDELRAEVTALTQPIAHLLLKLDVA